MTISAEIRNRFTDAAFEAISGDVADLVHLLVAVDYRLTEGLDRQLEDFFSKNDGRNFGFLTPKVAENLPKPGSAPGAMGTSYIQIKIVDMPVAAAKDLAAFPWVTKISLTDKCAYALDGKALEGEFDHSLDITTKNQDMPKMPVGARYARARYIRPEGFRL